MDRMTATKKSGRALKVIYLQGSANAEKRRTKPTDMLREAIKWGAMFLGAFIFMLLIFTAFFIGISRYEEMECLKWKAWETGEGYYGFHSTTWQDEQCLHYGIELKEG